MSRRLRALLIIGVILDLCIGGALIPLSIQTSDNTSTTRITQIAQYQSCQAQNRTKAEARGIWYQVLTLVGHSSNPAIIKFKDDVNMTYRPNNCAKLTRYKP